MPLHIKFNLGHFRDIERLAMVGEKSGWPASASLSPRQKSVISTKAKAIRRTSGS